MTARPLAHAHGSVTLSEPAESDWPEPPAEACLRPPSEHPSRNRLAAASGPLADARGSITLSEPRPSGSGRIWWAAMKRNVSDWPQLPAEPSRNRLAATSLPLADARGSVTPSEPRPSGSGRIWWAAMKWNVSDWPELPAELSRNKLAATSGPPADARGALTLSEPRPSGSGRIGAVRGHARGLRCGQRPDWPELPAGPSRNKLAAILDARRSVTPSEPRPSGSGRIGGLR